MEKGIFLPKGIQEFLSIATLNLGFLPLFFSCGEKQKETLVFRNLGDSASYVGMETCASCHPDKKSGFMETGMGLSIDSAHNFKSAGDFSGNWVVKDTIRNFCYRPIIENGAMLIHEFRIDGRDTVYSRKEKLDWIIGSGQHTNSHLIWRNGYLFQAPLTYYTQKKKWDLPPGFEHGKNSRFSRKIGIECMTCHNGYPKFDPASENKFLQIPSGIDCERCHGPGSLHVSEKKMGVLVDISKETDYSIVNPAKLAPELAMDLCSRCHLQGNAVLLPGKKFTDFKPGMKLSDVMVVFRPAEKGMIMASHVERLKKSKCFIESDGNLTCITCHSPHTSVKHIPATAFNQKCQKCHPTETSVCKEQKSGKLDCTGCHMPKSGSTDIPHVISTDHFIRKGVTNEEQEKIEKFTRLIPVNTDNPSPLVSGLAWMNQFEKFEGRPDCLDSAWKYLKRTGEGPYADAAKIRYYFLKGDFEGLIKMQPGEIGAHPQTDLETDSWKNYYVGEAWMALKKPDAGLKRFTSAASWMPGIPEFKNKMAFAMAQSGDKAGAMKIYRDLTEEHPYFSPGWSNLGYLLMEQESDTAAARVAIEKALALDPDYSQALKNMVSLCLYRGDKKMAQWYFNKINRQNFYD